MGRHGRGPPRGSQAQNKPAYPRIADNEPDYTAQTKLVTNDRDNRISQQQVLSQLQEAPPPGQTGKSGYPHEFKNKKINEKGKEQAEPQINELAGHEDTTKLHEYPVFADGHTYNYASKKPKEEPGHLRGITNQDGAFKGVIAHDGKSGYPQRGGMHWVVIQDENGKGEKGKDEKGKDSEGKDEKGKDEKGKDEKGKDEKGKDKKGKDEKGKDEKGKDEKGKDEKGKDEKGKDKKGKDEKGKDEKGKDGEGKRRKGKRRERKRRERIWPCQVARALQVQPTVTYRLQLL